MFKANMKEKLPHTRIRRFKVQRGGGGGGGSKLAKVSVEINTCVHVARMQEHFPLWIWDNLSSDMPHKIA